MPTLNWIGKDAVVNHHQDVPFRTLNKKYTFDNDSTDATNHVSTDENKIIHGDNLEALKALLPEYEGRIKCIYIDPPYNTGNKNWVYNDNVNSPKIRKWLGQVVGKEFEDLSRHDKWLCMMYPRLVLLKKLLADDGAIFISIDDNEQANLKLICDEIFGIGNFEGCIHWRRRNNQPNDKTKLIGLVAEFIFVYAKNAKYLKESGVGKIPLTGNFTNPDNDPKGEWASKPWKAALGQGGSQYVIKSPDGQFFDEIWLGEERTYYQLLQDGRIYFPKGRNGKLGTPRKKYYKHEREEEGQCATNWWRNEEAGCNQDAADELKAIFGNTDSKIFDTPKPSSLIERIICLGNDKHGIFLDSFAGSGTTAHAVLNLNKQDGGNRKFILVEMEDYAESITAERVRRVIKGYGEGKNAKEGTGGSFTFYELGEPIFKEDGYLNESVGTEKLCEYIWYTEIRKPYSRQTEGNLASKGYLLGTHNDAAYYFYYEPDKVTTLDKAFLNTITVKADMYVIYADNCLLNDEFMHLNNIKFKKIPRDIKKI